ncbi:MAG: hypothetical protein JWN44_4847 [Myxococcales bacterium]|nr:hypothetical protein [Myxococcales bacterium]
MLRALADDATALIQLQDAAALARVDAALTGDWRAEASALVGEAEWKLQLVGAAALVRGGGDAAAIEALWRAIDGSSWVAPQLVAAAFFIDEQFAAHAERRLLDVMRRPPKTIGALVRAYHRSAASRLPVVAQLGRHDRTMASEEARVGVRGVDTWLDRLVEPRLS